MSIHHHRGKTDIALDEQAFHQVVPDTFLRTEIQVLLRVDFIPITYLRNVSECSYILYLKQPKQRNMK